MFLNRIPTKTFGLNSVIRRRRSLPSSKLVGDEETTVLHSGYTNRRFRAAANLTPSLSLILIHTSLMLLPLSRTGRRRLATLIRTAVTLIFTFKKNYSYFAREHRNSWAFLPTIQIRSEKRGWQLFWWVFANLFNSSYINTYRQCAASIWT